VRVLVRGVEQDSFETASVEVLGLALRHIYPHLSPRHSTIQFVGLEERRMLGTTRRRREIKLDGLGAAVAFLT
jgi:hypothetical protein